VYGHTQHVVKYQGIDLDYGIIARLFVVVFAVHPAFPLLVDLGGRGEVPQMLVGGDRLGGSCCKFSASACAFFPALS
jgi:hypothetical protein